MNITKPFRSEAYFILKHFIEVGIILKIQLIGDLGN